MAEKIDIEVSKNEDFNKLKLSDLSNYKTRSIADPRTT